MFAAAAVLDATGTAEAVVVGFSSGVAWSIHLAANHPERVRGIVALGPSCQLDGVTQDRPGGGRRRQLAWDAHLETTEGWAKYNREYWLNGGYDDYVDFFARKIFTEPHSTKQIEDCVRWAHETTPETLAYTTAGQMGLDGARWTPLEPLLAQLRCPVLVVHGTEDAVRPARIGERLAELTGGDLVLVEGGGHGLAARDPVLINRMIKEFVMSVCPETRQPGRTTWTRAQRRPRRALYLSSPIGLGHARRDLAVARELRTHHPDLQIDWLTQHPVTRVLEDAGERVHPASAWLASESEHIEAESGEHDLHAFQAIRRMDAIMVNNFLTLADVVEESSYDLVIGDEAWDVDYFLHENPELKRFSFAWMTDFVGWVPMPDGGDAEAALTADYNAEMIEQRARYRRVRDRSVFVGNPDDVVDLSFGPGLPGIREWTEDNFEFAGYVTGFAPPSEEERAGVRADLGLGRDDLLCVVTVGGSGVGGPLLHRVLDAVPVTRRAAGAPVPRGHRSSAGPQGPAATSRRDRARLRPRPLSQPRRVRPRRGAGRPDHVHGARGQQPAVSLRAAAAPLRAERARAAPARASRRRPVRRLRRGLGAGRPRGRDRRGARPRLDGAAGGDRRRRPRRRDAGGPAVT